MNISEDKAKEVLEFLASRCNCYLRGFVKMDHNEFMLMLGKNDCRTSNLDDDWLYGFSSITNCIPKITTYQASYADYLDKCLDIASKSYVIRVTGVISPVFIPKNTTLEQILIEMDMNNAVNKMLS